MQERREVGDREGRDLVLLQLAERLEVVAVIGRHERRESGVIERSLLGGLRDVGFVDDAARRVVRRRELPGALTFQHKAERDRAEFGVGGAVGVGVAADVLRPESEVCERDAFSLTEIAKATGLSLAACSRFRAGTRVPHPRHWEAFLALVKEDFS